MNKRILLISIGILALLLLSGASYFFQRTISEKNSRVSLEKKFEGTSAPLVNPQRYVSGKLGIAFNYVKGVSPKAIEFGNKILHPEFGNEMYIEVGERNAETSIEQSIVDFAVSQGANRAKCRVVKFEGGSLSSDMDAYRLDFISPNIPYTSDELKEIKEADVSAKKDKGPFDGMWKKQEIYNKRLVQMCSAYAERLGLGTSKTFSGKFLYNPSFPTKVLYITSTVGPYFFDESTIEIIQQKDSSN